ncbi:MAG: hypothetical protein WBV94_04510 [Blastocatellia bacterium]
MKVINNHRQPLTLDSGVILAAAGTPGSQKEVDSISDADRKRYTGRIAVIENPAPIVEAAQESSPSATDEPEPEAAKVADRSRRRSQ